MHASPSGQDAKGLRGSPAESLCGADSRFGRFSDGRAGEACRRGKPGIPSVTLPDRSCPKNTAGFRPRTPSDAMLATVPWDWWPVGRETTLRCSRALPRSGVARVAGQCSLSGLPIGLTLFHCRPGTCGCPFASEHSLPLLTRLLPLRYGLHDFAMPRASTAHDSFGISSR